MIDTLRPFRGVTAERGFVLRSRHYKKNKILDPHDSNSWACTDLRNCKGVILHSRPVLRRVARPDENKETGNQCGSAYRLVDAMAVSIVDSVHWNRRVLSRYLPVRINVEYRVSSTDTTLDS